MKTPFNFDSPDGEAELKRWLGERLPEFVTLSDHIWKILGDPNVKDPNLKNQKLVDMAAIS